MRREYFGALAAVLPERDLARVLLLAGLRASGLLACLRGRQSVARWIEATRAMLAGEPRDSYSNSIHLRISLPVAQRLATALGDSPEMLQRLRDSLPALWEWTLGTTSARYRVTLTRPGEQLDLQWLAHVFVTSDIGVETVVAESRPGAELFWEWPMRIGVLPTRAGAALAAAVEQGPYRDLYDVHTVAAEATQFDLLLLTGPLAEIALPPGLRAGALLVLGAAESDRASTTKALQTHLYQGDRAGLAALCFVPNEERLPWLMTVVRELSHNAPLDTALFKARLASEREREGSTTGVGDLQVPLVFASEQFLQGARVAEAAKRIGAALQTHEQAELEVTLENVPGDLGQAALAITDIGKQLVLDVPGYVWKSERGDAATLARVRRQVEAHVGPIGSIPIALTGNDMVGAAQSLAYGYANVSVSPSKPKSKARPVPKMAAPELPEGFAMAEPPETPRMANVTLDFDLKSAIQTPPAEDRHVQCRVTQGRTADESIKQLHANENYRALIHIGPIRDVTLIVAAEIFDESLLPPSEHGHELDIVFCPLVGGTEKPAPPLVRRVHLPKVGDSDTAEFHFASGATPEQFRARVIVLHRNRIIQTLLLLTPAPGQDLALEPENLVTPFLGVAEIEAAADLAFVINDNPAGMPGITTIATDTASFIEPVGLAQSIDTVKKLLTAMNISAVGTATSLNDKAMVDLMVELANHGVTILREIRTQLPIAPYEKAERVQVVEAVANAYLPVEFLYSGKAPAPSAKLCPNAAAALASGDREVHRNCEHAKDPDYVCPAAFWGFSKCIERQPFGLTAAHVFSVPKEGTESLEPFKTAVVAASKRVDKVDMTGPAGLETGLKRLAGTLRRAKTWSDWQKMVSDAPPPTLLVLLPHSADSPTVTNMPALEIADSWLESSRLDEDYVHPEGSAGPGPLVLLLGCSTALTEIAFLNFVREFKRSGASIVLGTLATIHGKQATAFAARLLGELKTQGKGKPFDQTLLKVKQQLLAGGEPFVLSLAAYGHSSWLIKS